MQKLLIGLLVLILLVLGAAGASVWLAFRQGVSARAEPSALEALLARRLRDAAIPAEARQAENPVPLTAEVLVEARDHYADHCAVCHGDDGAGRTLIGENVYPPAPDLAKERTQSLSDGELFWIIHNGVRFTAMPGWGSGAPEEDLDSWELVHFIRRIPKLTPKEIGEVERRNPMSRAAAGEEGPHQGAGAHPRGHSHDHSH
ncbi:MAG: c-type cytochrome [Candidatus Binatia bacterium]